MKQRTLARFSKAAVMAAFLLTSDENRDII